MSVHEYTTNLSHGQLRHTIAALKRYRDKEFPLKVREFLNRLADIGVDVARERTDGTRYSNYVTFTKEVKGGLKNPRKIALVAGRNSEDFIRHWISSSFQPREAKVNSMLMLEFGSGQFADPSSWRGTFPDQHLAHFDSWYWYEYSDETHDPEATPGDPVGNSGLQMFTSSGEKPKKPMMEAADEMRRQILSIAHSVFD